MTWILANWIAILAVASTGTLILERIANLTPNTADNKLVDRLWKLLNSLGGKKNEN